LKKIFVFFLLFTGGLLYAQQYREAKIYVPPLDGVGFIDDMALFYKKITGEIVMQYRSLGKARVLSDYVITGKVMPIAEVEIELPPDSEGDENVLFVELYDNAVGEAIGEQYITYSIPDENTENALSVIIYNLLSAIPDVIELYGEEDNWRHKFIYFNPNFLWEPKRYLVETESLNMASIGVELLVDVSVLDFLAVKVGAEITQDMLQYKPEERYVDMIITFPLAAAYIIRPLSYLMLEPYLGVNFNFSLQKITKPYLLGVMAGFQAGIKAGPGIVVIDPRISFDVGQSYNERKTPNTTPFYWRIMFHIGVGYKFGFFKR